jgi:hypothetical protein
VLSPTGPLWIPAGQMKHCYELAWRAKKSNTPVPPDGSDFAEGYATT